MRLPWVAVLVLGLWWAAGARACTKKQATKTSLCSAGFLPNSAATGCIEDCAAKSTAQVTYVARPDISAEVCFPTCPQGSTEAAVSVTAVDCAACAAYYEWEPSIAKCMSTCKPGYAKQSAILYCSVPCSNPSFPVEKDPFTCVSTDGTATKSRAWMKRLVGNSSGATLATAPRATAALRPCARGTSQITVNGVPGCYRCSVRQTPVLDPLTNQVLCSSRACP